MNKYMAILFVVLILMSIEEFRIHNRDTRINRYQNIIVLYQHKKDSIIIQCTRCNTENVRYLLPDSLVLKYYHQIQSIYPTLLQ